MTLQILHPGRFGIIGTVEIVNGLVKNIKHASKQGWYPLAGMKGWREQSVREYAMRCNWIVSPVDSAPS